MLEKHRDHRKLQQMMQELKHFNGNIICYTLNKFARNKDNVFMEKVYFFLPCGFYLLASRSGVVGKNKCDITAALSNSRKGLAFSGREKERLQREEGLVSIYFYDVLNNWNKFRSSLVDANRTIELNLLDIYKDELNMIYPRHSTSAFDFPAISIC